MEKLLKIIKVIQEYWLFITIIGGGIVGIGKIAHEYYFIPVHVEPTVRSMAYELYSDSSQVWTKRMLASRPSGFRTHLSSLTGVNKDDVADSIANIYNNEKNIYMSVTYLMDKMRYQVNFNTTIFLMSTESYVHRGVRMRKTVAKDNERYDVYYKDGFEMWWKAIYYADEDAYYFIPDYTNGERIKCE